MENSDKPHSGIELDAIDLSQLSQTPSGQEDSKPYPAKIDYKIFVKDILKKILKNDSFLSFSSQIGEVNRILKMKYSSANDIADVIVKDVALTTKLLKLVNSSFYGQFSTKGIATISEAMIILGTEEIKLAAASLKIYELIQDVANIKVLKDKAFRAMQRSIIARQITIDENVQNSEAIQISAMLYDFGEYLVALFSPDVFIRIEILMDEENLTREQASKNIIGVSYSDLGRFVASKWNLPASIIYIMKPVAGFSVDKKGLSPEDTMRFICAFSDELCNIDPSGKNLGKKTLALTQSFQRCINIPAAKAIELLNMSLNKMNKHAAILKAGSR
jgi:HD-like signal output (HDOD) protein